MCVWKASREMRQTMLSSDEMSHISDMHERYGLSATTLRGCAAGMVFPTPGGASHASGMMRLITPSERPCSQCHHTARLHRWYGVSCAWRRVPCLGMMRLITPSERPCMQCHHTARLRRWYGVSCAWRRVSCLRHDATHHTFREAVHALPPHCALSPHCVWCYLRLTVRLMPPA